MERAAFSKNEIIQSLTRSQHGDLPPYQPVVAEAAKREPEFLAHLIAWNHEKGAIRDTKIALPVYSLAEQAFPPGLTENSAAHLAMLSPRDFVRALDAAKSVGVAGKGRNPRRLVERYLRHREASYGLWESAIIQHRASMKTLYGRFHIAPGGSKGSTMDLALFKGQAPTGSSLEIICKLPTMGVKEALGHCVRRKFPFLVVVGALGRRLAEPEVMLAFINSMSPSELATNAKMLDKFGVQKNPILRDAFRQAVQKAADAPAAGTLLKAGKKAREVGGTVGATLAAVQERQITATGGVKGRWLVIGDKSGSMEHTIQIAREVASHLARFAEQCTLMYVDSQPSYIKDVTGKPLEEIQEETKYIRGEGGTAMFMGVAYAIARRWEFDGIAICTDCEDGNPAGMLQAYQKYAQLLDREPTLYIFRCPGGHRDTLTQPLKDAGILTEVFDLRAGFDHYSLPNIIQTLSTRKWGLLDQIMETPLKRLEDVFTTHAA